MQANSSAARPAGSVGVPPHAGSWAGRSSPPASPRPLGRQGASRVHPCAGGGRADAAPRSSPPPPHGSPAVPGSPAAGRRPERRDAGPVRLTALERAATVEGHGRSSGTRRRSCCGSPYSPGLLPVRRNRRPSSLRGCPFALFLVFVLNRQRSYFSAGGLYSCL